jgi:hypothetical protein
MNERMVGVIGVLLTRPPKDQLEGYYCAAWHYSDPTNIEGSRYCIAWVHEGHEPPPLRGGRLTR